MALSDITNNFGYTEMYEWDKDNIQEYPYGYFVEFGNTNKIVRANDPQKVIGVTTICSTTNISDNPNHWPKENIANEFGDVRVHKKQIVEGHKVYDDKDEFSYIKTSLKEKYVPNKTPMFIRAALPSARRKPGARGEALLWVRISLRFSISLPGLISTPSISIVCPFPLLVWQRMWSIIPSMSSIRVSFLVPCVPVWLSLVCLPPSESVKRCW